MNNLNEFLAEKGFQSAIGLPLDGTYHRFDRTGELSGWFTGQKIPMESGEVFVARVGDWRTGETYDYKGETTAMSDTDKKRLEATLAKLTRTQDAEKALLQGEVAIKATGIWHEQSAELAGQDLPTYLKAKGLSHYYGARTHQASAHADNILLPLQDTQGKIWSLQWIDAYGSKSFLPRGKLKGNFFLIGKLSKVTRRIYVCEGYATGATLHLAGAATVLCAMNAGNLEAVAKAARAFAPLAEIIIAGDNDQYTVKPPHNTPWNPGWEKAEAAATAVRGKLLLPCFTTDKKGHTDFNDLMQAESLATVSAQLAQPLAPKRHHESVLEKVLSPGAPSGEDGQPPAHVSSAPHTADLPGGSEAIVMAKKATHQKLARILIHEHGPNLLIEGDDIFQYTGTHWRVFTDADAKAIQREIGGLGGERFKYSDIIAVYNLFLLHVDSVPPGVNLFVPPERKTNFRNGTLHADVHTEGGFELNFRPHAKTDWVTNLLPYDYDPAMEAKNAEFDKMLGAVFGGDPDKEEKILALSEMFGACLMPVKGHLFMLHGGPGTGKSTVIKLASRLVSEENICNVDPTQFEGFHMHAMVGKLVNIDTDIEVHKPMTEKSVKKVEDDSVITIDRKFQKPLRAKLPYTHIFGANAVPRALDGASKAQTRRWTFLKFNTVVAVGAYNVRYDEFCFNQSPMGILNFALRGLQKLVTAGGHFTQPASGKEDITEWQLHTDPVGRFLIACEKGEILVENSQMKVGLNYRIKPGQLWVAFSAFHSEEYSRPPVLSRCKFYALLRDRGYEKVVLNGYEHYKGLGVLEVGNSKF